VNHWFTADGAPIVRSFVKRFDPLHWTVDFPRGSMASIVTGADGHGVSVAAEFLRKGDIVGLIFESRDRHAHPAHRRETNLDYSKCQLSFHWQSTGLMPLDAVNGPTLTVEGRDESGVPRSWYVRLWNYAQGTPTAAEILLDFDALNGGFVLPAEADRVYPRDIDRMFISLVPPDFGPGSNEIRGAPAAGTLTISGIACDGSGSVLAINDAVAPEHRLRIATAYDDMYHLPPERVVQSVERLGHRGLISHYVGMSHYFGLNGSGLVDPLRPFNSAALAWHRDFARAAAARGYEVIWSLSYEILDMFCPEAWKQREFDGSAALTGYSPPSTLVSPASTPAIEFLAGVVGVLVGISEEAGLRPQIQIGEPWWWVTPTGSICLYDAAAKAALGGSPVQIANVRTQLTQAQKDLLDQAGTLLASSTAAIASSGRAANPDTKTLLLAYLPVVLDPEAPELRRANLPVGWARPAFDVLQIEDYEWVTGQRRAAREAAYEQVDVRLGYPSGEQHYFAGFAASAADRADWEPILSAAWGAQERGLAETIIWALPQVLRDGLMLYGEEQNVAPFEDILFPIEIGSEASVSPAFSTSVVTNASGFEARNVNWQQARLRFDAGPGVRGDAELEALISFFRARRGAAVGFRFRDAYDYSSNGMSGAPTPADQLIGTGDGATSRFELTKTYGAGEKRRITRPVAGSVRIAVSGNELMTGWTLDALGTIQFTTPPPNGAAITAGFEFDVPIRFADDRLEVNRATFLAGEAPSVPLIEIREA
jgi:uncharacterized protein (TIGR02217 family)